MDAFGSKAARLKVSPEVYRHVSYTPTEPYGNSGIGVHDRGIVSPDIVPRKAMLWELRMVGMCGWTEAWKDDRDASPHRFATIERSLRGCEQAFQRFGVGDAA